jgi:hypothetical protein
LQAFFQELVDAIADVARTPRGTDPFLRLLDHGSFLLDATLDIHHLIADGFLNHQIHMRPDAQPTLFALKDAL